VTSPAAVGVSVVNYNGGERVLRVLEALRRQPYPLGEIVVVDNASTDGSRELIAAEYPEARLLALESNVGLSIARNVALRELRTPLVLLLDHDVYVGDACIGALVRSLEARGATVACPRIRLIPERDVVQADGAALHFLGTLILRNAYRPVDATPAVGAWVDGCIGACMLVRRDAVLAAGGFDELFFFYFEDLEFAMRLGALGLKFWCEPTAEVFHELAAGTPNLSFRGAGRYPARRAYYTMRNRLLSMLVHYRLRTLAVLAPVLLVYELASLAAALRKGCGAQWLRAWWWLAANGAVVRERRRRMQRLRTVTDRELLVGGAPPLAPAFLSSHVERQLYAAFAKALNGYWLLARGLIG
jgi:GT2 family glycosyltransferase